MKASVCRPIITYTTVGLITVYTGQLATEAGLPDIDALKPVLTMHSVICILITLPLKDHWSSAFIVVAAQRATISRKGCASLIHSPDPAGVSLRASACFTTAEGGHMIFGSQLSGSGRSSLERIRARF